MSRAVSIQGVFLGTSPFLVAMAVLLAIVMVFPDLAMPAMTDTFIPTGGVISPISTRMTSMTPSQIGS